MGSWAGVIWITSNQPHARINLRRSILCESTPNNTTNLFRHHTSCTLHFIFSVSCSFLSTSDWFVLHWEGGGTILVEDKNQQSFVSWMLDKSRFSLLNLYISLARNEWMEEKLLHLLLDCVLSMLICVCQFHKNHGLDSGNERIASPVIWKTPDGFLVTDSASHSAPVALSLYSITTTLQLLLLRFKAPTIALQNLSLQHQKAKEPTLYY